MQIYQKSRLKMFRISTPDNYFANQYSTDENCTVHRKNCIKTDCATVHTARILRFPR